MSPQPPTSSRSSIFNFFRRRRHNHPPSKHPFAPVQAAAPVASTMVAANSDDDLSTSAGVSQRTWKKLHMDDNMSEWMETAEPIFEEYTWRTGGSNYTQSERAMSWHFRHADPEWGQMQAQHLQEELEEALCDYPVSVVHKKGLVEVVQRGVHKGVAIREVLRRVAEIHGGLPEFVLCVGDDTADEHMFTAVLDCYSDFKVRVKIYRA